MRLGIITVTYDSEQVLLGFLESLDVAFVEADVVGVVAVDNASRDDTLSVLESSVADVTIIPSPTNLGYAAGINLGLAACPAADAYLIVNPDVRLLPGSVAALLAAARENPTRGIIVPRSFRRDGLPRYSLRRDPSLVRAWAEVLLTAERAARIGSLGERVGDEAAYRVAHDVDWASGSTMLIGASCLRSTGAWDETFFLYSEETDFCLRARDHGFRTYFEPAAEVVHLGGASQSSPQLHAVLFRNRLRLYRKHHGLLAQACFALPLLLKEAAKAMRGDTGARAALRDLLQSAGKGRSMGIDRLQRRAG
jgi:N-acetylglucosaminyl-diphospho-decaprenol L-rhamnosyltransferase